MGFSIVPLVDSFFRRSFLAAGLHPQSLPIDAQTTIHFWISESLSNSNSKTLPLLLLIHGFGPNSTWQWRRQVGPLSRRFALLVPDLVFFGGSTTRSDRRSESFQAESIVRLVESLGLAGRIAVVGTSYGGFVAYHVARMLGDRVHRVVIASSDVLKGREDDRKLRERAGVEDVTDLMLPRSTGNLRTLVGLALYRQPRFMPEFVLRDVLRNLYNDRVKEKMELIKGITLSDKDEFQMTPLPQDVLIVWGEHDHIFPLEKAFEVKKHLGEKARLEIVKNTGHMPQAEDPTRFNEILLNFLIDPPPSSP